MNKRLDNEENYLEILRKISDSKNLTQRELANQVGFSLGKLNYCLNELKKKGLIKYNNFKNNKNKMNYVYILTPKGVTKKTKLLISFMQRKMKEYDEFKQDLENIQNQNK
mgnify:CR=1 FL=1|tara:strand:+ start:417 stop:746 length:330 start_codon:yes stop_codon:yes gene_type:complete